MWEVAARMHARGTSWIVPASEGKRLHRLRFLARREARRLTRQQARREGFLAHGLGMAPLQSLTWEVRPYGPKHRRAPFGD